MDRQTTFLLALGLLIAAAATVSLSGWVLYVRDRRAHRAEPSATAVVADAPHHEAAGER